MAKFKPIWFDSLGAKSSCILIQHKDTSIIIDPGAAIMQPSFPAPYELKIKWTIDAEEEIRKTTSKADIIIITHYHYDHYMDFEKEIYAKKVILAKNPNEYINDSQRKRAIEFYSELFRELGETNLNDIMLEAIDREYPNPLVELKEASSRDYGEYTERKRKLLDKGLKWFKRRAEKWVKWKRIPEHEFNENNTKLIFADNKSMEYKGLKIKFTKPLFHGIEFSRVGWIVGVVIEAGKFKLLYSSDVNGPIIEDYAEWIINEKPSIIILDGPMTYMLGYMLNKINLKRAIENAVKIIEEANANLIIYDHHLPRERKFKEHTKEVWKKAEKEGVKIMTAAEYLGKTPAVLVKWQ